MEKLTNKVENSQCHVSDIKKLIKTVKETSSKIENYKENILAMEEKLESKKSETLNVEGITFIIL